jgi:hypothetical protein
VIEPLYDARVSELVCDFSNESCFLGVFRNVAIQLWAGKVTMREVEQALASTKRIIDAHGGVVSLSIIRTDGLPSLGEEERKRIGMINRTLEGKILANVQVVEGKGFTGSAVRAILSGINLFNPNRARIFDDVGAAAKWMEQQPGLGVRAHELAAAVESARASWKR